MEKLTGLKKIKTAVFISGNGSNLKNIIFPDADGRTVVFKETATCLCVLIDTVANLRHTRVLGSVRLDGIFQHLQGSRELRVVRACEIWL